MPASEFIGLYEAALATQSWDAVSPLIHDDASVVFSDGSVHRGKEAVRVAFERNFHTINDEVYRIANVHWLLESDDCAVYMFDFFWTGTVAGEKVEGAGRGTSVLVFEGDQWKLLAEHLGPGPRQ